MKKSSSGLLGALAIASGSSAYGGVVVVTPPANLAPASLPQTANISRTFDLNGDAITDFTFQFRQPQVPTGFDWQATIVPATGNFVFGVYGLAVGQFYVQRYLAGEIIGNTPPTHTGAIPNPGTPFTNVFASRFSGKDYGQFLPPNSRGFVGLQITVGANTFYGYIELSTKRSTGAGVPGIAFFSAAYDNTPSTPITAGAVPEPGTLAMLAFGAATVVLAKARRRRSKRQVTG